MQISGPHSTLNQSLMIGLKKGLHLNKLFRWSWYKFENPWRVTTACKWLPLSAPASSADPKTRTWEQKWGNYTFLWQIIQLPHDFTSVCHRVRRRGWEEGNVCSLPLHQASSFQWPWLAFLASVLSWQCPFGFSEERRGELVWVQNEPSLSMWIVCLGRWPAEWRAPVTCTKTYPTSAVSKRPLPLASSAWDAGHSGIIKLRAGGVSTSPAAMAHAGDKPLD